MRKRRQYDLPQQTGEKSDASERLACPTLSATPVILQVIEI